MGGGGGLGVPICVNHNVDVHPPVQWQNMLYAYVGFAPMFMIVIVLARVRYSGAPGYVIPYTPVVEMAMALYPEKMSCCVKLDTYGIV